MPDEEQTESGSDKGGATVTDPSKSKGDSTESTNLGDSGSDTGATRTARK